MTFLVPMAVAILKGLRITVAGSGCCVAGPLALAFSLFVFCLVGRRAVSSLQLIHFSLKALCFSLKSIVCSGSCKVCLRSGCCHVCMFHIWQMSDQVRSDLFIRVGFGIWEIMIKILKNFCNHGVSTHRFPEDLHFSIVFERKACCLTHIKHVL